MAAAGDDAGLAEGTLLARVERRLWGGRGGDISVGGWIAVLMVFVLSRVFAAGAAMRDELLATV